MRPLAVCRRLCTRRDCERLERSSHLSFLPHFHQFDCTALLHPHGVLSFYLRAMARGACDMIAVCCCGWVKRQSAIADFAFRSTVLLLCG